MSYSGKVKGTVNSKASEKPAAVPMNVKAFIDGMDLFFLVNIFGNFTFI